MSKVLSVDGGHRHGIHESHGSFHVLVGPKGGWYIDYGEHDSLLDGLTTGYQWSFIGVEVVGDLLLPMEFLE